MRKWDVKVCATVAAETAGEAYAALAGQLQACADLRVTDLTGYIALESDDPVKSLEVNALERP